MDFRTIKYQAPPGNYNIPENCMSYCFIEETVSKSQRTIKASFDGNLGFYFNLESDVQYSIVNGPTGLLRRDHFNLFFTPAGCEFANNLLKGFYMKVNLQFINIFEEYPGISGFLKKYNQDIPCLLTERHARSSELTLYRIRNVVGNDYKDEGIRNIFFTTQYTEIILDAMKTLITSRFLLN